MNELPGRAAKVKRHALTAAEREDDAVTSTEIVTPDVVSEFVENERRGRL